MDHVSEKFIEPLLAHFPIRAPDPAKFLRDLTEELKDVDADTLARAARHLIKQHDKASFPYLRECLSAVRACRADSEISSAVCQDGSTGRVLAAIRDAAGRDIFLNWFADCHASIDDGCVYVLSPSGFKARYASRHHAEILTAAVEALGAERWEMRAAT